MTGRMTGRLLECLGLFVALPLVFVFEWFSLPKIPVLLLFTLGCVWLYARMPRTERNQDLWSWKPLRSFWPTLAVRTGLVVAFCAGWVFLYAPQSWLAFPRQRPGLWLLVMLLYPWLSALPQEFLYRTFFFARYRMLFGEGMGMLAASSVSFAMLHLIYDHPLSVILSLVGGYWFSRTYQQTRSLSIVALEHALYGMLVFTLGLGRLFYEGR